MRSLLLAFLVIAIAFGHLASGQASRREIENVAAFARLYGVVRYFYPSDAAASLDWDRFAVYGVGRVRAAGDPKALEAALQAIFRPLGPGIEIGRTLSPRVEPGSADTSLIAWRYLGAAVAPPTGYSPYRAKRTNRPLVISPVIDGFVSVMQSVSAASLRGKRIRLRGQVRALPHGNTGSAALWLRVDRAASGGGFFDNMSDRPIRLPEWREYSIEGTVADDATSVAFGAMASGAVTADFDAVDLAVDAGNGLWTEIPIADAGFESTSSTNWMRVGVSKNAQISRLSDTPPQGIRFLRFSAPSPPPSTTELFADAVPVAGAHVDIELGAGLKARVPLALTDAQARLDAKNSSSLQALQSTLAAIAGGTHRADVDTRLADIVCAWNVFRHFYPYWPESGVDWDVRLRPLLELSYAAGTRQSQRDALRQLVADARDGHGTVSDPAQSQPRAVLPIRFAMVDDTLVVTASDRPTDVPVGSVVSTIDGVPSRQLLAEAMRLASGTPQWTRIRAVQEIGGCAMGATVTLIVDSGRGPRRASLKCEATVPAPENRPASIGELTAGIWYVDLTRAMSAQVTPVLETLAHARGVVFDVRGYPTDAGAQILPHLLESIEADRWMHISKITGPFGQSAGWQSAGWNLLPRTPRLTGTIVFLTDGRAISYAESVMGYVADRKLGTIIGSTTAGTNGNVAGFSVPGGFSIRFTGMRVTRHDGRTPFHLVGVEPDISVMPTVGAIRAGRDEVLDRAIALILAK